MKRECEQQRVKEEEGDLFYGKTSEVFEYMENIVENYERGGKHIVLSKGEIFGNNVKSLSKKVHTEILKKIEINDDAKN